MDIALLSRSWLSAINFSVYEDKSHVEKLISSVIGLYLCDILGGTCNNLISLKAASCLSKLLENHVCSQTPTTRSIMTYFILSQYDLLTDRIRQSATEMANILSRRKIVSPTQYAQSFLLYRMGLLRSLPLSKTMKLPCILRDVLKATEDQIYYLCDWLGAISQYGGSSFPLSASTLKYLSEVLPIVTLQRLRFYNLNLGAELLRSLLYLKVENEVTIQAIEFLVSQQRSDGSFGFFAFNDNDYMKNRDIYLSTTVACLWTIAELYIPGFRLFWGKFSGPKC